MRAVICILSLFCIICVWAQSPPQISDSFLAHVNVTVYDNQGEHHGKGIWGANQESGKGVESYAYEQKEFGFTIIERYDLGNQYDWSEYSSKCFSQKVNGTMPKAWDWLSLATYKGSAGHGSESVDLWEATIGYATMRVGVLHNTPSVPVYLIRESRDEKRTAYYFASWTGTAPDDKYFALPASCDTSYFTDEKSGVSCVSGSTAIARAKVWVAAHVPYNQGAKYHGYREDCSGFVSMCWESSEPGHTTSTMHEIAHPISKSELKPGDCLLFATEHVVLFGGWTNSEQTYYQAYEETRPGEGTVTRNTPYPYWYSQSSFKPYRYNAIC